jgi:hypothetical protein
MPQPQTVANPPAATLFQLTPQPQLLSVLNTEVFSWTEHLPGVQEHLYVTSTQHLTILQHLTKVMTKKADFLRF